jgi:CxxC-x17-CxxC domain-containing protein
MEQHRDEQIVCADCGEAFVFSAGEAALFAERNLASPKRCKACRRARKDLRAAEGAGGRGNGRPVHAGGHGGPPRGAPRGPGRGGPPQRYTGDVNEYRSPMQDRSFTAPSWPRAEDPPRRAPRRPASPAPWSSDGVYRAPSTFHGDRAGNVQPHGPRPHAGPRHRAPSELFHITCSACGAQAEVPFQPAEGRDVFCQPCYRARRPPV